MLQIEKLKKVKGNFPVLVGSNVIPKSICKTLIKEISNVLEKYQIKIDRLFEKKYIKNLFEGESLEISIMAFKIKSGHNQNEIALVPKSTKKIGFFEKFFQLFS